MTPLIYTMMTSSPQLQSLLTRIDALNSQDPDFIANETASNIAKEVLYSQRMQYRLAQFFSEANEALQIAAYSQHIQRWASPRSDYPMDRSGYKKWRTNLGKFHAELTASAMLEFGYNEDIIERVKYLLQKKGLKRDPDTQALEDVICLVFIEHYLEAFAAKHSEDKIISIIQKTWNKMSNKGHDAALKLPLSDAMSALVGKALKA
jgi:hypothetical protein